MEEILYINKRLSMLMIIDRPFLSIKFLKVN